MVCKDIVHLQKIKEKQLFLIYEMVQKIRYILCIMYIFIVFVKLGLPMYDHGVFKLKWNM